MLTYKHRRHIVVSEVINKTNMVRGEGIVESVVLQGFEEQVTALAAVSETFGSDHPLVRPQVTSEIGASNLTHTVLEFKNTLPELEIENEHAQIILDALEATAGNDESRYKQSARYMLDVMNKADTSEAVPKLQASTVETAPVVKNVSKVKRLPPAIGGVVMNGHVALGDFGQLTAAYQAVVEFGHNVGTRYDEALTALSADIEQIDPFSNEVQPVLYWGDSARIIHNCLQQAATRNEELHDREARFILDQPASAALREAAFSVETAREVSGVKETKILQTA